MRLQLVWPSASTCPHYSAAKTDSTLTATVLLQLASALCASEGPRRLAVQLRPINQELRELLIIISFLLLLHTRLRSAA